MIMKASSRAGPLISDRNNHDSIAFSRAFLSEIGSGPNILHTRLTAAASPSPRPGHPAPPPARRPCDRPERSLRQDQLAGAGDAKDISLTVQQDRGGSARTDQFARIVSRRFGNILAQGRLAQRDHGRPPSIRSSSWSSKRPASAAATSVPLLRHDGASPYPFSLISYSVRSGAMHAGWPGPAG